MADRNTNLSNTILSATSQVYYNAGTIGYLIICVSLMGNGPTSVNMKIEPVSDGRHSMFKNI